MLYDAIVIGLGAMGSATLYQLSRQTPNVLGIDQFEPPHTLGSTHGDTRITRQAIGEGLHFVPLTLRSYQIWRELEQQSGEKLLTITGGLFVGQQHSTVQTRNKPGWLTTTLEAAEQFGITHRILDTDALRHEFPQFRYAQNDIGYYEPEAGFLHPERCIRVQLEQAQKAGASVHTNEQMLSFQSTDSGVTVLTDKGSYQTRKLILTTGSWVTESLRQTPYSNLLQVYRQVLYWFAVEGKYEQYTPDNMPIFILNDQGIYGFPAIDGPTGGLKVATETYEYPTTPNTVNRTVSQAETQRMYEQFVEPNLNGIGPQCIKSVVCLYTMTPNGDFILDQHPDYDHVLLASACSGHGFKHSAAVGQIMAELALIGTTKFDISPFRFSAFSA
ncbi:MULTISPECIES: N-methyl-L-tryptophan oxidase [unclassified Spirosoma]|uniref:N-methyl-L-tryptophan oxidase n=1 Tax=unclassified Spirosoma TaxID=2621999 RepID=UPI0009591C9D|nr:MULTISPECIES: N-methyl-L-tryptophan oxidase [unclassified Spirosoma]MBN8824319.1 N-methyl-L-tryptophan oxidase [Spirosoma sp.]OJW70212.1 MAG: N-methyltryptophan oxidase [Spirosoma sp. 48-14]